MESLVTPIRRKAVADLVFEQLRDLIFQGQFRPGDRIPPPKELADGMQVNLVAVRQAIQRLVAQGVLEVRRGEGAFVQRRDLCVASNPFSHVMSAGRHSLDELLEVRVGLECHAVRLAAARADESDLLQLETCLARLAHDQASDQEAADADAAFHMGIACATHNSVHVELIKRFYDYLFHSIARLHRLLYDVSHNRLEIQQQHAAILAAIRGRDSLKAHDGMMAHIAFLREFLRRQGIA